MRLEIVFEDGRKESFDNVANFSQKYHMAHTPTEGKLFEVSPRAIARSFFQEKREDPRQEEVRQMIQEAFAELDKHPEKYADTFYTLIPIRSWNGYKTIEELMDYAADLGGLTTDWVEQALEWAQQISNGESWESICNYSDTANWFRLIIWKDGEVRLVGGSRKAALFSPSVILEVSRNESDYRLNYTVPLVRLKKDNRVHIF